jgi:ornithine cyclodeaminase/alanine dehydrogenase-like protein (mu-crystallin family)
MLQGHIDRGTFTVIILVTVATMLATPFLATDRVAWWLMRWHPAGRRPADPVTGDGHVLLLGAGSTGMQLLEDLVIAGADLVVVDDDPATARNVVLRSTRMPQGIEDSVSDPDFHDIARQAKSFEFVARGFSSAWRSAGPSGRRNSSAATLARR